MAHIWIPGVDDIKADMDQYRDAQHERNPHGHIFINGQQVADTLQCPHCGGHFVSRKGSGHRRSFCMHCREVTCGAPRCTSECTPFTMALERSFGREF
jgi:hypothetical protein